MIEEKAILCTLLRAPPNTYFERTALTWIYKVWMLILKHSLVVDLHTYLYFHLKQKQGCWWYMCTSVQLYKLMMIVPSGNVFLSLCQYPHVSQVYHWKEIGICRCEGRDSSENKVTN